MFRTSDTPILKPTKFLMQPEMSICQSDYPIDWYQQDFIPYAQEYQNLPNRKLSTICEWMEPYIAKAQAHFDDTLLLLAHYYMGGEIVKLIEHFGGEVGDSYQLALKARQQPEKKFIVESAVHFMAESISILAHADQNVYITNPKSGCTMEMLAKDYMVEPALSALNEKYGSENILPVCYMNTSGRVKALCGAQGGAVCTSSNVKKIFQWAMSQNKKILFIPDKHMGENVAHWLGMDKSAIAYWPGGSAASQFDLQSLPQTQQQHFDKAELVLFESFCAVHTVYQPEMANYWRDRGYTTLAHPECTNELIKVVDGHGSTAYLFDQITQDKFKTKKYAVATENHMVANLKQQVAPLGIEVVNLAEAEIASTQNNIGCGCATMSRNDPPHLVATLDLLRQGNLLDANIVKAGDVVNEASGMRSRLHPADQQWVVDNARKALQKMIEITER
jgi:quinolinate synthase